VKLIALALLLFAGLVSRSEAADEDCIEITPTVPLAQLVNFFTPTDYHALPFHSHNDYKAKEPLFGALQNKVKSIEADIYLDWPPRKKIRVAHNPWENDGNLEDLYLDPLQESINNRTLLLSAEDPLLLWIDIKGGDESALPQLASTLARYPMIGKEVQVILTGGGRRKQIQNHFQKYPQLSLKFDSDKFPMKNPASEQWYTLNWSKYSKWKGDGPMPQEDFLKVQKLVEEVKASGGRLRFYNSPDHAAYWEVCMKLGVDLINTDDSKGLREYWEELGEWAEKWKSRIFGPKTDKNNTLRP
jgi:hypothetical protein